MCPCGRGCASELVYCWATCFKATVHALPLIKLTDQELWHSTSYLENCTFKLRSNIKKIILIIEAQRTLPVISRMCDVAAAGGINVVLCLHHLVKVLLSLKVQFALKNPWKSSSFAAAIKCAPSQCCHAFIVSYALHLCRLLTLERMHWVQTKWCKTAVAFCCELVTGSNRSLSADETMQDRNDPLLWAGHWVQTKRRKTSMALRCELVTGSNRYHTQTSIQHRDMKQAKKLLCYAFETHYCMHLLPW